MLNSSFKMLATDYDGTIATRGRIPDNVEKALLEVKQAGLLIAIVTGRGFDDLLRVCRQIKIFDLIVLVLRWLAPQEYEILYRNSNHHFHYLLRFM